MSNRSQSQHLLHPSCWLDQKSGGHQEVIRREEWINDQFVLVQKKQTAGAKKGSVTSERSRSNKLTVNQWICCFRSQLTVTRLLHVTVRGRSFFQSGVRGHTVRLLQSFKKPAGGNSLQLLTHTPTVTLRQPSLICISSVSWRNLTSCSSLLTSQQISQSDSDSTWKLVCLLSVFVKFHESNVS